MQQAAEIVMMDPNELTPHPRNTDFFDNLEGPVWDALVADISMNGVITPMTVTDDNVIIAGHQRHRAALAAGIKQVPVRRVYIEDEDERIERMICDNYLSRFGATNITKLGNCATELERIWNVRRQGRPKDDSGMTRAEYMERMTEMTGMTARKISLAKNVAELDPSLTEAVDDGTMSPWAAEKLFHGLTPLEQKVAGIALECGVFRTLTYEQISELVPSIRQYAAELEQEARDKDEQINELRIMLKEAKPGQFIKESDYDKLRRQRDEALDASKKAHEELSTLKNANKKAIAELRERNKRIGLCSGALTLIETNMRTMVDMEVDPGMMEMIKTRLKRTMETLERFREKFRNIDQF